MSLTRDPAHLTEIFRMVRVLEEAEYRILSASGGHQRLAVSQRLFREGVTEQILRMLWAYAVECGHRPGALFAYWIDLPSRTMQKIQEMRSKRDWASRRVFDAKEKERASAMAPVLNLAAARKSAGR